MAFPSTFVDIQNAVIAKARLNATNDVGKVRDWINQGYAAIASEVGPFAQSATMALTAGTNSYTFPSSVHEIHGMSIVSGGVTYPPLQRVDLDTILRYRLAAGGTGTQTGTVTHYALIGLQDFEVYPTPQAADTITIYYTGLPTALSADSDTTSLPEPYASKCLEYWALAEAADWKSDPEEQEYRALAEDWKRRLRGFVNRRSAADQFRVDSPRVFPPHDPSTDLGY